MAILNAGIVAPTGGYQISRSLRFNSADSAYLSRTPSSTGNRQKWTLSFWAKFTSLSNNYLLGAGDVDTGGGSGVAVRLNSNSTMKITAGGSLTMNIDTVQVFRDPSAWYHIVLAIDTTQATNTNRVKIYVNGVESSLSATTWPAQNTSLDWNYASATQYLGAYYGGGLNYSNCYLTEINNIDGQALTPSSFGETDTDTGVWKPKAYSGSYGTNGFYLKFADNSGTTSTTLGKDSSGLGNNWTPNNFSVTAGAGNDSLVDTPTPYGTDTGVGGEVRSNYCTLNPLDNAQGATLSNGNLQAVNAGGTDKFYRATFGMSSGKWYWEVQFANLQNRNRLGITDNTLNASGTTLTGDYALVSTGNQSYNTSTGSTPTVPTFATNDYICFAFDADAGILYFEKNATPNTSTSPKFTGLSTSKTYFVTCQEVGTASTNIFNFGQRAFQYTATSGFKALCTQNLPEPTIKDGTDYFNTVLYTGNGGTAQNITGVGFQPDFVWLKSRNSGSFSHRLYDAVRGAGKELYSNDTAAESNVAQSLTAFISDGFSLGTDTNNNATSTTYVAWNWKANGAGSSNTAGTITSTVSVNTTSGFSIVTWTATNTAATIGHGLGVAPAMIIVKSRADVVNWTVYHQAIGNTGGLVLNGTNAVGTNIDWWNNTSPTSSVFSVGSFSNYLTGGHVAYCFAPVAGYSAFGSYTGNGSADGPFVYTGFRPRFLMYKNASSAGTVWIIFDSARNTYNFVDVQLRPNESSAENSAGASFSFDFLSNGFKVRSSDSNLNGSGNTMIYAAFAENPFKYSLAR